MEEASSAYDRAENVQATAASTKDRMTAGPAVTAPSPITTKMPVPMIAPTPIAVSPTGPTERLSPASPWVSETRSDASRVDQRPAGRAMRLPFVAVALPGALSLGKRGAPKGRP